MEQGLDGFAEHEVLEILLYYCYPRCDTNEIAHNMLKRFGSLHNLFEAEIGDIVSECGCTENVAVLLHLIPAVTNLYYRSRWDKKPVLDNEKSAGNYVTDLCAGRTVETFYLLCLNTQRQLNHVAIIAEGTLDETAVYPRAVVGEALRSQATAVILAHNHPGGSVNPSRADLEITRRIMEGLTFIGIAVLDHIVVSGGKYYSFAARGQIVGGY